MAENGRKHFICDKCERECRFGEVHDWPPYNGWIIDLDKYVVLCPTCVITYIGRKNWTKEIVDTINWSNDIANFAAMVNRKGPPL